MVSFYIFNETTEKIALILEESSVKEIVLDRPDYPQRVGNIYLGKVEKIEKGLQAAFINIGIGQNAFIQRKDIPLDPDNRIESIITEGQALMVQVIKDAYDKKGPRVTANIAIPGQYLIYMPFGKKIVPSQKLEPSIAKQKTELFRTICTEREGVIIRTSAHHVIDSLMESEFLNLRTQMSNYLSQAKKEHVPTLLFEDNVVTEQTIRNHAIEEIDAIYVDHLSTVKRYRKQYPKLSEHIYWEKDIQKYLPMSVDQLLKNALDSVVTISNGVTLTIEETEAMVVIDVNSGGFSDRVDQDKTKLKTNLQAAKMIADQIRLRNLSGMIIIDFITMRSPKHRQLVIDALKKACAKDRIQTVVYGFTKLGLLEVTRKRQAPSLSKLLAPKNTEKKNQYSTISYVYSLERILYQFQSSDVEALLIQVEPKVMELWRKYINAEKIKKNIKQVVFIEYNRGVTGFYVKRTGTEQLIHEYIKDNKHLVIDKII